jgi:hypothetical protein
MLYVVPNTIPDMLRYSTVCPIVVNAAKTAHATNRIGRI